MRTFAVGQFFCAAKGNRNKYCRLYTQRHNLRQCRNDWRRNRPLWSGNGSEMHSCCNRRICTAHCKVLQKRHYRKRRPCTRGIKTYIRKESVIIRFSIIYNFVLNCISVCAPFWIIASKGCFYYSFYKFVFDVHIIFTKKANSLNTYNFVCVEILLINIFVFV